MKIYASKPLPATQELLEILNQEFSDRYSCQLFGLGKKKTIMVRQSFMNGAQVSTHNNEITIQGGASPVLAMFGGMTELAIIPAFFLFLGWLTGSQWKNIEKEVAVFLNSKFN